MIPPARIVALLGHAWTRLLLLLVVLAAIPAFSAAPRQMPSDSKLYLYLNPTRLIGDAFWSFDPRQFAGWVPHQHITFLWPSGPWFWLTEQIGLPDWIAHRAWIAGLMVVAGAGAARSARLLGLTWTGAAIAAVLYQLSPYTLAYVSRTSVMLLPWAGLGWILALTILASRRRSWAYPALIALVVVTVGSVNPTAIAMIAPAPVIWLVHAASSRLITWGHALKVAAQTLVLSVGVSAWWITMVWIQRRYGAPVLGYSETLNDVSASATAPEVLRGLGYWLFYVRDSAGPATTAAVGYMTSPVGIAVSFLVAVTAMWAIAATQWIHRRFVVALIFVGVILAVGVHPIESPSPLMGLLADTEAALALRSSTRAVPMLLLAMALIIGARVPLIFSSVTTLHESARRSLQPAALVLLVVTLSLANLPAWWTGGFVDPALLRQSDPPAEWVVAAASIDERPAGFRLLQLPGAEFGSFRWGHTVDQPLVALTERPLITRDLLPLGSAEAMDLVFSLDDRLQQGNLPTGAVSTVARLLGVDVIWLANDLRHERYVTVRPDTLRSILKADQHLQLWNTFGEPQVWQPNPERIDTISLSDLEVGAATPAVMLWEVADPTAVIRARAASVVVGGSADGIIDAAGAGLISPSHLILYAATSTAEQIADADLMIVTDSNRARPRHWRSSQDVLGATEASDPALWPLTALPGDQRLGFGRGPFVTAEQRGPVTATASSYGERFAYQPEHRPAMAIDSDLSTAWRVGTQGDPVGERLRLQFADAPRHLRLVQPEGGRHITAVQMEITTPSGAVDYRVVELGPASRGAIGQLVDLPVGSGPVQIDLVILAVSVGPLDPVGFAAVTDLVATEFVAVPDYGSHQNLAFVFTRDRRDPRHLWRSDPEPHLRREFTIPAPAATAATPTAPSVALSGVPLWQISLQLSRDSRASEEVLADALGAAAQASTRLAGVISARGHSAVDGDPTTAWITGFDQGLGATLQIRGLSAASDQLRITQREGDFSQITAIAVRGRDADGEAVEMRVQLDPGATEVTLPQEIGPGPVEIEVTEIAPQEVRDPHYGRRLVTPVAISQIDFGVPLIQGAPQDVPECVNDLISIDGRPLAVRIDPVNLVAEPCDPGEVVLTPGPHFVTSTTSLITPSLQVDQVVLRNQGASGLVSDSLGAAPRAHVTAVTRLSREVEITGCDGGCWLVLGEGFNRAFKATLAGRDLGPPTLVDGGFNGWYLSPEDAALGAGQDGRDSRDSRDGLRVELRWTAQRPLTLAFVLSGLTVMMCIGLVMRRLIMRRGPSEQPSARDGNDSLQHDVLQADQVPGRYLLTRGEWRSVGLKTSWRSGFGHSGLWAVAAAVFIGPIWAIPALWLSAPRWWGIRSRLAELVAVAAMLLSAVSVVAFQVLRSPAADLAWPAAVGRSHGIAMFGVVSLIVVVLGRPDGRVTSGAEDL